MTVNVTKNSFLHPSSGSSTGYGHLIFYADRCSEFQVNVDYDLIFTGSNIDDRHVNNRELTLTFSGQGRVKFKLASGKQISFDGLFGGGNGASV